MKAELRLGKHSEIPGQAVFEVWFAGRFIGQVTGADGPGIRFLSKYPVKQITPDPTMPLR
jgi:hypothetical protein